MNTTAKEMKYIAKVYEYVRYSDDPENIKRVQYYKVDNVSMFFHNKNKVQYIVFIGSNEFKDWLYNFWFSFSETPYKSKNTNKDIKVHKGFYKLYLKVRDEILKRMNKCKTEKIVVVGHSMGGALATLCALDLQYNLPDKDIGSFTTGSPKVGNSAFVSSFNRRISDTVRCTNGNDLVPSLPPFSFGFHHVGKHVLIGKPRWHAMSIKDHLTPNYIKYIKEL
jgi:predicted lipase